MEFIKDQEKRILLSAISREKKVIKERKELAELIPVINQLDYYFMYDRLFKQIYNQALEDMRKAILTDKELQFAPYSQEMWFKNRIMDIAERLTRRRRI